MSRLAGRNGPSGGPNCWRNRDAGGLKHLPERALDLTPDHVSLVVYGDRRFLQVIQIADDVGPLECPAVLREPALEFLTKDQARNEQKTWPRIVSSFWW